MARPQRRDQDDGDRLAETVPVAIEGPDGALLDTGSGLISCRLAELSRAKSMNGWME